MIVVEEGQIYVVGLRRRGLFCLLEAWESKSEMGGSAGSGRFASRICQNVGLVAAVEDPIQIAEWTGMPSPEGSPADGSSRDAPEPPLPEPSGGAPPADDAPPPPGSADEGQRDGEVDEDGRRAGEAGEADTGEADTGAGGKRFSVAGLLTGPRFVLAAFVAAVIGVLTPGVVNYVGDHTGPPVVVNMERLPTSGDDYSFVLPRAGRATPVIDHDGNLLEGIEDSPEIFDHGDQAAKLVVRADNSDGVVIVGMRAHILRRGPSIDGTLVSIHPQGAQENIRVGFNLDDLNPIARTSRGGLGDPYFEANSVVLDRGEKAVFTVEAFARRASYTWDLELDLVIDGKSEKRFVRPKSGPLQVTGPVSAYQAVYALVFGTTRSRFESVDPLRYCARPSECAGH
ncbi:hypothetical protein [Frankia gtarii]|uniref:hypothetical protein n=1 Tax=Frankia gtarii TaxID=2950102 RepID=UPI0021C03D8E|nr:hypothetical protein [Frankia gtarii]